MAKESVSERINYIDYLVLSNDKHGKRRCIDSFVKSINYSERIQWLERKQII
jgi:hypothetical protein